MILDPKAYEEALSATAEDMTKEIRGNALMHGWDSDVVDNMHVEYSEESGFKVKVHPDYHDRAFMHEYGRPGVSPTAVIRKFSNREATESDKAFIHHLNKRAG